jgi:hypothetical protein
MLTKQISFLCALPRTGSTFLSSIINQSKQIQVMDTSVVPDLLANLLKVKESSNFINLPYHKGIDNVVLNVFNNYYSEVKQKHILDRSCWGTPGNLEIIKSIFKKRKFVFLVRPVLECLASFVKASKMNGSIDEFCKELMDKENGPIGKNVWSIQNLIKEKEEYHLIHYDDLIKNTQKEIDKMFDFLEIKKEKFKLKNFNQYKFEGISHDDKMLYADYHTIRVEKVKKIKYKVEDYLSKKIINQYRDIKI